MNCTCPKWKYKELKTTCACGGVAYYQKIDKIDEKDNKKAILEKLKNEVSQLRTDITIKKMEIRDLENEMTDIEEQCVLDNGAIVTKAGLPNCDCSSCN